MSPERRERLQTDRAVIEYCGTPFGARYKFLVHNAIEDMVGERLGEKVHSYQGISSFTWPKRINEATRMKYDDQIKGVKDLLGKYRYKQDMFLIQDGALAGMALTRVMQKANVLGEKEAEGRMEELVGFAKKEDLIISTLVTPRAALSRLLYPPEMEGYEIIRGKNFIFFEVYNQAMREVMADYGERLPRTVLIEGQRDEFDREEIFFLNAQVTLEFLGLPSVDEWSEKIRAGEVKKLESEFGNSLAGLTREEIKEYLRVWDWSQNRKQKKRAEQVTKQIVEIIDENLGLK